MTAQTTKLDPRIRRTRQLLFEAFQNLLAEKSFHLITVQDIAERSTLNRAIEVATPVAIDLVGRPLRAALHAFPGAR